MPFKCMDWLTVAFRPLRSIAKPVRHCNLDIWTSGSDSGLAYRNTSRKIATIAPIEQGRKLENCQTVISATLFEAALLKAVPAAAAKMDLPSQEQLQPHPPRASHSAVVAASLLSMPTSHEATSQTQSSNLPPWRQVREQSRRQQLAERGKHRTLDKQSGNPGIPRANSTSSRFPAHGLSRPQSQIGKNKRAASSLRTSTSSSVADQTRFLSTPATPDPTTSTAAAEPSAATLKRRRYRQGKAIRKALEKTSDPVAPAPSSSSAVALPSHSIAAGPAVAVPAAIPPVVVSSVAAPIATTANKATKTKAASKAAKKAAKKAKSKSLNNDNNSNTNNKAPNKKPPPKMARGKSPKRAPSMQSGGVPEPTPIYLANSAEPLEPALASPRRLLVVLDLNGTILYRPDPANNPRHQEPRPHAADFLAYLVGDAAAVLVWSSVMPFNVERLAASAFTPELRDRLVGVWGRDRIGLAEDQYHANVQCYKRLSIVWADDAVQATHPDHATGGRWDHTNTVIVDDSAEKARAQPHNLVLVPEFSGASSALDDVLPQLHDYINVLSYQPDVSRYIRANPFTPTARWEPKYELPSA